MWKVLVVDDDSGTAETLGAALRAEGYDVTTAATGRDALALGASGTFDAVLLDLRLPDRSGIDVLRGLRAAGASSSVFIMTGFGTVSSAVEAMKLGAQDYVEKPLDGIEAARMIASAQRSSALENSNDDSRVEAGRRTVMQASVFDNRPAVALAELARKPQSSAQRLAALMLTACKSEFDLRTLEEWGRYVGVGRSTLRGYCRVIRAPARDARDFMRMLRAILLAQGGRWQPETLLSVGDCRTLSRMLERSGLHCDTTEPPQVSEFLERQTFLRPDCAALGAVRCLLKLVDHADRQAH